MVKVVVVVAVAVGVAVGVVVAVAGVGVAVGVAAAVAVAVGVVVVLIAGGEMSDKSLFILSHRRAREIAVEAVKQAPDGYAVEIKPVTRSLEQNSMLWSLLTDVSSHVLWHGRKLSQENWKHVFTSSLNKMDVVPNLEGNGFVVLGLSTSKMNKKELSDLVDLILAFGHEHGVKFNDTRTTD